MLFFQPVEHPEIKRFPLFNDLVPYDFLSPAQDYAEKHIDLNDLLVQHPSATYFVKPFGDSMMGTGIGTGGLLVIDGARKTAHGGIVTAAIEGEFAAKRLQLHPVVMLKPEDNAYAPITTGNENALDTFGVVAFIIKSAD